MNELATFVNNAINASAFVATRSILISLALTAIFLTSVLIVACIWDKEVPAGGLIGALFVFCASTLYLIGGM